MFLLSTPLLTPLALRTNRAVTAAASATRATGISHTAQLLAWGTFRAGGTSVSWFSPVPRTWAAV